jgi:hypothetical protein
MNRVNSSGLISIVGIEIENKSAKTESAELRSSFILKIIGAVMRIPRSPAGLIFLFFILCAASDSLIGISSR